MTSRLFSVAVTLVVAALVLTACGASANGSDRRADGRLAVVASFYPLQFAAEQIGGPHVAVTGLTKPGAEPHDLELTPRDVATVATADAVIYQRGLQPAVDEAVRDEAGDRALDVAPAADLDLRLDESGSGAVDPHFWLDPLRYRTVAQAVADRLAGADPAHRADYRARAQAFEGRLTALDADFARGLSSCERPQIVTSHSAFGYLARRYHLSQVGITGLSPDAEPTPGQLAAIAQYVRQHGVTVIYTETLASPAVAETLAKETGAAVKVLDPVEGISDASAGRDYFEVMRSNLSTLRAGQGCS